MAGVNRVILVGRLGKDPETIQTTTGSTICKFSLATSENFKKKDGTKEERTEWHRVVCFGKIAEIASQYVKKGSLLYIEGSIKTSTYDKDGEKRYSTDIIASNLQMLGGKGDGNSGAQESSSNGNYNYKQSHGNQKPPAIEDEDFGDDVPF